MLVAEIFIDTESNLTMHCGIDILIQFSNAMGI